MNRQISVIINHLARILQDYLKITRPPRPEKRIGPIHFMILFGNTVLQNRYCQ